MKEKYAILPDRIKAVFIDGIILVTAMYATSEVLSLFDNISIGNSKIALNLMTC